MKKALALLAGVLALALGCSKGSIAAGPTPTPFGVTRCHVVWATQAAGASTSSIFTLNGGLNEFEPGPENLSVQGGEALFYSGAVLANDQIESYAALAAATAGSYSVIGEEPGVGTLDITSTGADLLFAADASGTLAGQVGSGGAGSFSGTWSNPLVTGPYTPGTGTVTVNYRGSPLTLGSTVSFAYCTSPVE